jgi:hypothetical protein
MKMVFKFPWGRSIVLDVDPYDAIENIALKVKDVETSWENYEARLIFRGKHMREWKLLSEYDPYENGLIHVIHRLPPRG